MPTPAVAGLKFPALTPVPLYVPPAGKPPVNAYGAVFTQVDELDGQVTVGGVFTITVTVELELLHDATLGDSVT